MKDSIILRTKNVGEISGDFFVEDYQRGYRWGEDEVIRLLDDIYNNGKANYCLQPIVVRFKNGKYELIDGQQRLTTLYLIYKVMNDRSNGFLDNPHFSIDYRTREETKKFLLDINTSQKHFNIDFYHLSVAYETIDNWFSTRDQSAMTKFNEYLFDNVKVIWYEVNDSIISSELFKRLNIGKILLTSAELVKAMFLMKNKEVDEKIEEKRQEEISLQWDNMEKELHDESLWYFLTNSDKSEYHTRIDLILDLISGKKASDKGKYFTYFTIDSMKKEKSLQEIWKEIQHTFLILKDWFENHELYHKVGYLIASGHKSLLDLYELSKNKTKSEFILLLDGLIKESVNIKENYGELSYTKPGDRVKIARLLLLFNVESVRRNGEKTQWFPFDKYKIKDDDKVVWSLEHIHAQQSEGLKTVAEWIEWLKLHLKSIRALSNDNKDLISRIETVVESNTLSSGEFAILQNDILNKLSSENNLLYMHSISNMAMLNFQDNAALSNSTFAVKRNNIIEMDQKGQYIPFCTRMVYLKYYSLSSGSQMHIWSIDDMKSYVNHMNIVLEEYLAGNTIIMEEDVEND